MKFNKRKVKIFFKLHWIAIVVVGLCVTIAISFAYFLQSAIQAWITSESYFKKSALAQYGLFFYI
ncbi:MAG: hypothetical protein KA022_02530, partial [Candidatus Omnitrophica bacterium]|nr:hypothetical protein [Candidatus Omnitrophota bacterium]